VGGGGPEPLAPRHLGDDRGDGAMLAARRMRDAVTVELEDAWMVLNR